MSKRLMIEDRDGDLVEVPSKLAICDTCEGEGKVENPAFSNGISGETWAEWDDEDRGRYMEGAYDVRCSCCGGAGMVRVANFSACTFGQKRLVVLAQREAVEASRDARADWLTRCAEDGISPY